MNFAFFAANFGYSKADYYALTPAEKKFLAKAYEDKVVADSNILAAAVANAVGNVLRKKNKRPQKLWKKKPKQADTAKRAEIIQKVVATEEKSSRAWVDAIYQANGKRTPKQKGE